jgi:hypothetical protein
MVCARRGLTTVQRRTTRLRCLQASGWDPGWTDLGGYAISAPSLAATGPDTFVICRMNREGQAEHRNAHITGGTGGPVPTSPWTSITGQIASRPTIVADRSSATRPVVDPAGLQVYAITDDGTLIRSTGGAWTPPLS